MAIYRLGDDTPIIHETAYVSPEATVIGRVTLGAGVSVWPGAVIRADNDAIDIGAGSNIQEGAVLHVDAGHPLIIGEDVTVGHQAMLHGCRIGDNTLIGIQAVILNDARIDRDCLVGACTLITERKTFEPGVMILGSPGQIVRTLAPEEIDRLRASARHYVDRGAFYKVQLVRIA